MSIKDFSIIRWIGKGAFGWVNINLLQKYYK